MRRRLPGQCSDTRVHPRGGDGGHGRGGEDSALGEPVAGDLRARLPAGVAVRGRVQHVPACRSGGDRQSRALRGRLGAHAAAPGRGEDHAQRENCRHRRRPRGAGLRRRTRPARLSGHHLRGAARGGRRAALRHSGVPAAEGDSRLGNRPAQGDGGRDRLQRHHRQDAHARRAVRPDGLCGRVHRLPARGCRSSSASRARTSTASCRRTNSSRAST